MRRLSEETAVVGPEVTKFFYGGNVMPFG